MTEAILIEIAHRFRKLEDAVEEADIFHAAAVERKNQKIDRAEDDYKIHKNYDRWCREANELGKDRDNIEEVRTEIEKTLEACREDMVNMQELIRRTGQASGSCQLNAG